MGSGFWIDNSGDVAPCFHVAGNQNIRSITIRSGVDTVVDPKAKLAVFDNWEAVAGQIVAADADNDIAIIRAQTNPFTTSHPARLEWSDRSAGAHYEVATLSDKIPEQGSPIMFGGYPLGEPYAVFQSGSLASTAVLSSLIVGEAKPQTVILISAVANHGNSGGPVFNKSGQVIGLLEGEVAPTEQRTGLERVVPAFYLEQLMTRLKPAP